MSEIPGRRRRMSEASQNEKTRRNGRYSHETISSPLLGGIDI
jgi:hypothetical protein